MGGLCCKLFRRDRRTDENERVVDLREDQPVKCPVQCVDTDDSEDERSGEDFIDLREDVPPVLCTEP